jgi:exodeoxyribonuclease V beta subunit
MSAVTAPGIFDLTGPLSSGITVLEASAGTGKTFAITALAVRHLADGRRPDQLLLVTFTNAATSELRERVRRELVRARDALGAALAGAGRAPEDDLLKVLLVGPVEAIAERHERLARAVAGFDSLTIATIHSFCQQVLRSLGVAGDAEEDFVFLGEAVSLVDQVIDDLYIRDHASVLDPPPFDHELAREIGRAVACRNTFAEISEVGTSTDGLLRARARFAHEVRAEVDRRKRRQGVLSYDDLQGRLLEALADPVRGGEITGRLRARYAVALIDEFQDTDPVQYEIVRRIFESGDMTLVLIGDPKQAIYSFRGADVQAYLDAAAQATRLQTMRTSWRSDADLLRACDALFGRARLGHPEIVYRPLAPSPDTRQERPRGLPFGPAMRIRVLHRDDVGDALRNQLLYHGNYRADPAREAVAADLARDIARLLSADAGVQPGDIAVLVRRRTHGPLVRDALRALNVPAVISGGGSVFETGMADEWLRLLEALERPSARGPAGAAALTVFIGWDAARVEAATDLEWDDMHECLARWALVLRRHGVAGLLATISSDEVLPARMLARSDGEREFTDLAHLGELLHAAEDEHALRANGLAAWLVEQMGTTQTETESEERSRRLDSDAAAVQVLTIHGAKGLEFPVVYCPYLWEEGWIPPANSKSAFPVFHSDRGVRTIAVGGADSDGFAAQWTRSRDEQRGEELRLLYVALTRARHQVVLWWAATERARHSPLARLLFGMDADGNIPAEGGMVPSDDEALARLNRVAADAPGCIAVERVQHGSGVAWTPSTSRDVDLSVNRLERDLDARWRRTSYSGITSIANQRFDHLEIDAFMRNDDEMLAPGAAGSEAPAQPAPEFVDRPLALAEMPASAEVGTVIHKVMEDADFCATDLVAELMALLVREVDRHRIDLGDLATVATGLAAALSTPWGAVFGTWSLAGAPPRDRLDEMAFEMPLTGGDDPHGSLVVGQIAELLSAHLPTGDPICSYAAQLATAEFAGISLRGYLTGFLDLVVRIPGADGTGPRFAVVDYKTNRLAGRGGPLTAWDYRPEAITAAMHASDYPLQALLYLVALHRYLRWRVPAYAPERHIAGVAYLFVRGMIGPETPVVDEARCGVWTWRPPSGLLVALSDLLDRGAS